MRGCVGMTLGGIFSGDIYLISETRTASRACFSTLERRMCFSTASSLSRVTLMPRGRESHLRCGITWTRSSGISYEDDKLGSGEEDHCAGGSRASLVPPSRFEAEDIEMREELKDPSSAPSFRKLGP